jgi:hypothetical protein
MSSPEEADESTGLLAHHSRPSLTTWIKEAWEDLEASTLARLIALSLLDIPMIAFCTLIWQHNSRNGWRLQAPKAPTITAVSEVICELPRDRYHTLTAVGIDYNLGPVECSIRHP